MKLFLALMLLVAGATLLIFGGLSVAAAKHLTLHDYSPLSSIGTVVLFLAGTTIVTFGFGAMAGLRRSVWVG
jgi:hypothetical protein